MYIIGVNPKLGWCHICEKPILPWQERFSGGKWGDGELHISYHLDCMIATVNGYRADVSHTMDMEKALRIKLRYVQFWKDVKKTTPFTGEKPTPLDKMGFKVVDVNYYWKPYEFFNKNGGDDLQVHLWKELHWRWDDRLPNVVKLVGYRNITREYNHVYMTLFTGKSEDKYWLYRLKKEFAAKPTLAGLKQVVKRSREAPYGAGPDEIPIAQDQLTVRGKIWRRS